MTGPATLQPLPFALPGPLPPGERVLWQGRPDWKAMARDALHLRGLSLYMAALVVSVGVTAALRGAPALEVLRDVGLATACASLPIGVAMLFAFLASRSARYMVTNRRVVMRIGVALPMTINLPFARVASAGLRRRGATGEIDVKLTARDGLSAVMLWPHARMGRAEPVLRGLIDAERAGQVLSRALAASVDAPAPLAQSGPAGENAPGRGATPVAA